MLMRAILLATFLALNIIAASESLSDTIPDWYHVRNREYLENYDLSTHALLFRTTRAEDKDDELELTLYDYDWFVSGTWKLKCTSSGETQSYEFICGDGAKQTVDLASGEEFLTWELHGNGDVKLNGDGVESCPDSWGRTDVNHIGVGGDIKLEVTPPQGSTRCPEDEPYAYDHGKHCCSVNVEFQSKEKTCVIEEGIKEECTYDRNTPCFNNIAVVKCPENHYMNKKSDINICDRCPEGEQLNGDKNGCESCAAGSYKYDEMNTCEVCSDNMISSEGAASCTSCEAGTEPNSDQSDCESCGEGTYRDDNMPSCAKCDSGEQPNTGKTACDPCEDGTVKGPSDTKCTRCGDGMEPDSSLSACDACPAGSFKYDEMNTCEVCSDNMISSEGAASCTSCEAGTEPNSDRTACEQYCEELSVKNGTVSPSGSQTEGTVVTVTCLNPKQYVLIGRKQVTCQANGSWSEKPECRKCGTQKAT